MFVVSVKHFVDMLICVSLAVGRILTNIFFDSLPMQSVSITTQVGDVMVSAVSSNHTHGEVYSINIM
jgi:biotin transporter BioY